MNVLKYLLTFVIAGILALPLAADEITNAIMGDDASEVLSLVAKDPKLLEKDAEPYLLRPLQLAAFFQKRKVADALLKHGQELDIFTAYHLGLKDDCVRLFKANPESARRYTLGKYYGGPLYWTVEKNDVQMAKLFLALGANTGTPGRLGSPLHYAVFSDRVEIAKLLLEHGADAVASANPFEGTLLHEARSAAMVDLLLKHGVQLEARNEDNETPLFMAVNRGRVAAVRRLVERGASMELKSRRDVDALTPFELALQSQYGPVWPKPIAPQPQQQEIAKFFLARASRLDFRLACMANDLKVVRDYVNKDPKILTTPIPYLHFALDWAVLHDNMEMFSFLIERYETKILNGGSIRDEAKKNFGPILLTAVKCDHSKMVRRLLELGAPVDEHFDIELATGKVHSPSPLLYAIHYKAKIEVIKALLDYRADMSFTCFDSSIKSPALVEAIYNGSVEVVKLLLEYGANPNGLVRYPQGPIIEAIMKKNEAALALLLKYKADLSAPPNSNSTPLHSAARMGTAKIVEMLLKHGASVNAVGYRMQTPLHRAAEADSTVPMLKVLLTAGAKHNVKDQSGNTPLHLAAFNFNPEGVRLLLAAGADPRVKNREGETPIEMIDFRRALRYPTDSLDWNKFWAAIRCDSILGMAVHK